MIFWLNAIFNDNQVVSKPTKNFENNRKVKETLIKYQKMWKFVTKKISISNLISESKMVPKDLTKSVSFLKLRSLMKCYKWWMTSYHLQPPFWVLKDDFYIFINAYVKSAFLNYFSCIRILYLFFSFYNATQKLFIYLWGYKHQCSFSLLLFSNEPVTKNHISPLVLFLFLYQIFILNFFSVFDLLIIYQVKYSASYWKNTSGWIYDISPPYSFLAQ